MVLHKKSLLEAFRASAPEGRAAEERKQAPPAISGGPFATPAASPKASGAAKAAPKPAPSAKAARPVVDPFARPAPPRSFVGRMLSDRVIQVVLLLGALAVTAAYLLGRGQGQNVQAGSTPAAGSETPAPGVFVRSDAEGAPSGPSGPAADAARKNEQAAQLGTVHDQAFHDPRNSNTVRVAQYKNDDNGLKLARATVAYLIKQGYPAVSPIVTGEGRAIVVCVGAKPKAKELEPLRDFLRQLRGPPPQSEQQPFEKAYITSIDDVLKRR